MRVHKRILSSVVRQICSTFDAISAMRSGDAVPFHPAVIEALETRNLLSTINWSNPSGGDWNTPGNWTGNKVPAAGDDAVINVAGSVVITYSSGTTSVRSITSTDTLVISGGALTVTGGTSQLSGGLNISGEATLTATGGSTSLNSTGATNIDNGNITAAAGATVALPGLTSYQAPTASTTVVTLQATGTGSTLDLSNLTSLTGGVVFDAGVNIEALAGGHIKMAALPTISAQAFLEADGTGSVLDISNLATLSTTSDAYTSGLACTNGGHVLDGSLITFVGPAISQDSGPILALDGTGVIATSQISSFVASQINLKGGTPNFSGITNFNASGATVSNGATLALPALTSYQTPDTSEVVVTLEATGTGSTLDMSHVTTLSGQTLVFDCGTNIEALAGGSIKLTAVPNITGQVFLEADGTGSVLDISNLASLNTTSDAYTSGLTCTNSGHVLDGKLTTFTGPAQSLQSGPVLTIDGTGVISTSQITTFTASQVNLSNVTPNFSGLTNFNASGATASNGATLTLSAVTSYQTPSTSEVVVTLEATGSGSTLDLSHVTNLSGPTLVFDCGTNIEALAGGTIKLTAVPSINAQVFMEADGFGSVLDISNLTALSTISDAYTSGLTCTNSGRVLDGKLTTFIGPADSQQSGPALTIDATGVISTSQISSYTAGQINITGGNPNFFGLTDFDASGATVSNGATLTLGAVTSYQTPATSEVVVTLEATGTGSLLDLSHVATLTGPTVFDCGTNVEALAGGHVKLTRLVTADAQAFFEADGFDSVLNLSSLVNVTLSSDAYTSGFQASNGGVILRTASAPSLALASNVNPSTYGQPVTFTATVTASTGTPTGNVTFVDSTTATTLGTAPLADGVAAFTTDSSNLLALGSNTITAEYNGDDDFAVASATMTQAVSQGAASVVVASSLPTSTYGQNVTFTATVSGLTGTPTGTVQFRINGSNLGSPVALVGGSASRALSTLHAGVNTITAVYSGDANFGGNTGTATQTVNKADQTIAWTTPAAISQGTALSGAQLNATVSGVAGGSAPGTLTYSPLAGAVLATGNQVLTVTAAATTDYNQATDSVTLVVAPAATVVVTSSAATSTYGQAVQFTATVASAAGTPTGSVQFVFNDTNLGSAVTLVNGSVSSTFNTLDAGTYTVTAVYSGDANFLMTTGSTGQTVNKADQTIAWATPSAIVQGTPLSGTQLDATVSGVAGGAAPGALVYSPIAGTLLSAGNQTLTVTAAATTDYNQASDSVNLTVNPSSGTTPPATTLTASKINILAGATETLTASVTSGSGTPTGSVTFLDGSTALQTVTLTNGAAAMDTTSLAFGVHSITFSYSGDGTFSGITSAATSIFVGNTAHQVIVNALYRQLLNRNAEETQSGLYYWAGRLDNGDSLSVVADGIATSVEYDTDIVTGIYQQYLHRSPDQIGLTNWVNQMQAGTVSYETIRGYILGSQEFQNDAVGQYGDYITGLYQVLLGRAPDSTGLAVWTQLLGAGSSDAQRDPVSIGISTSFEQYEDFVGIKFQQFLGRSPSAALQPSLPNASGVPTPTSPTLQGEQGFWADALNHGTSDGDFIADILSSTEYLNDQGLPTG